MLVGKAVSAYSTPTPTPPPPLSWTGCQSVHLLVAIYTPVGPAVRRPIGANPGLDFNPDFCFFLSKAFSRTIFSILFRVSYHQIVGKKNSAEFDLKAFISEFIFRTNPGLS